MGKIEKIMENPSRAQKECDDKYVTQSPETFRQHKRLSLEQQAELIERQNILIAKQQSEILELEEKYRQKCEDYEIISNAFFWKITKPARLVLDIVKGIHNYPDLTGLIKKGICSLKNHGVRYTLEKSSYKINEIVSCRTISQKHLFTERELDAQRKYRFSREIKFSIVVPLYNTPENYLREMIQSVINQTYANWELCMADGSDENHKNVKRICLNYASEDKRIHYQKLTENLGISGNTNACIEMATGDYIGLFDHDDILHPAALHEVMHAICEKNADFIYTDENTFHLTPEDASTPHFKPDFAIDNLRANNYICHFTVFKRALLEKVGMFDSAYDGSQDYDMVLRLTEKAERIAHIPEILYYWRAHPDSVASNVGAKPYAIEAAKRAISSHLKRVGLSGEVQCVNESGFYRIHYEIHGNPRISILIPNYEHYGDLKLCLDSIFKKTTYSNYEIVIVENNSTSKKIFSYYKKLQEEHTNLRVLTWKSRAGEASFNYSAINNFGAMHCTGEYFVLLNNDTTIINGDWLQEMLMFAQRKDVGAVGAKLYYSDGTIQHAGIGIGLLTLAGHYFRGFGGSHPGYMGRMLYAQDVTAVTAACMMIPRDVWVKMNGFDEKFAVAFNDVDLCMRIRKAGYLIIWTPFAELYHFESKSRGADDTAQKRKRFESEIARFHYLWQEELDAGDPYYNPNFSLSKEDFSINTSVRRYKARLFDRSSGEKKEVIHASDAEKTPVPAGGTD